MVCNIYVFVPPQYNFYLIPPSQGQVERQAFEKKERKEDVISFFILN
jgi:hypothetical protein